VDRGTLTRDGDVLTFTSYEFPSTTIAPANWLETYNDVWASEA
jgi:hypothetical protein